MADRFWVGGTGNWSSTARWSTSDGGGSGASVPSLNDDVYFTANSNTGTGSFTVTVDGGTRACRNFTASGLDGAMTLTGSGFLTIYGSLSLPATNFAWSGTSPAVYFYGTGTLTTNGVVVGGAVYIMTGAALTLAGAFSCVTQIEQQGGTIDLAGYTLTATTMLTTGSNVRSITFGTGGSIVLTSSGTVWGYSGSNLSFGDIANCVITLTSTTGSARTFSGNGIAYGTLNIGGTTGTSTLTITGNNTFALIASTKTVAHTIEIANGSTQTITAWTATGSAGNVLTITGGTTGGHSATINGLSEPLTSVDYCSVTRMTSAEINEWYWGNNSTDGGSNTNQYFSSRPTMFMPFFEFAFGA